MLGSPQHRTRLHPAPTPSASDCHALGPGQTLQCLSPPPNTPAPNPLRPQCRPARTRASQPPQRAPAASSCPNQAPPHFNPPAGAAQSRRPQFRLGHRADPRVRGYLGIQIQRSQCQDTIRNKCRTQASIIIYSL
ncbi:hypothetical protein NDU88_001916 [Pleurodeles waltl]|uniref:Uncharacterized protein n=1 Tax=Pleurodeles waltl TaxID=8319 RepID=A0AAV7ML51_PLEWA|nr:hypothetical protein NDU88_001916 [Pleurodeles waltl]